MPGGRMPKVLGRVMGWDWGKAPGYTTVGAAFDIAYRQSLRLGVRYHNHYDASTGRWISYPIRREQSPQG